MPGVVLFSAAVGIALIGIEDKSHLIRGLQTFLDALTRVARFVLNVTPIGVFAIGAVTAGTMTIEQFARLQVYFYTFIIAALVLTFWILPALISTITPFKYKDVLTLSKDALLTAFLTHSLFIVVPILVERSRQMLEKYQLRTEDTDKFVDIIIPVTFNFPNVGKLLTLLFIPFTAWMAGSALELPDYPHLFLIGVASYFAKAQTALPFLMDQFEIPQDLFHLYIPTSIITGKFDTLVSAINLLAFSLIGVGALTGYLRLEPARILRYLGITALVLFLTVTGTGLLLGTVIDTRHDKGQQLMQMHLMGQPVQTTVFRTEPNGGSPMYEEQALPTVRTIKERGVLRVGYLPFRYPLSFFNNAGELVGFDIEVVNQLAADLGVELEFIPVTVNMLTDKLNSGAIDLMANAPYLTSGLDLVEISDPILTATMAFIVKDHRRHDFESMDSLRKLRDFRIGVIASVDYLKTELTTWLPGVKFEVVELSSLDEFFAEDDQEIDAAVILAEVGMGFTLLYPEYTVVIPKPDLWRLPMGFVTAQGNLALAEYLDSWIAVHQARGSFQRAYNYWILGEGAITKQPRWSVIRNVLHWVE